MSSTLDIEAIPIPTPGLSERTYQERITAGPNAHAFWFQARDHVDGRFLGPLRIMRNYVVIELLKHFPSLTLKRSILRCLGMRLGRGVTIASGVMLDYFFPELIEVGEHTIIGMDAMLLTHEFLHDRYRTGQVRIGAHCLVGARSIVLAGVDIADGTVIAAMSLVHKGTTVGALFGGVPIRLLAPQVGTRRKEGETP